MFVHTVGKGLMRMTKPIKILGKRGRVTIPFEIRQALGYTDNDILSFTAQPDGTLLVRREKLCDDCEEKQEPAEEKNVRKRHGTAGLPPRQSAKRNSYPTVRPLGRKREQPQETEERP